MKKIYFLRPIMVLNILVSLFFLSCENDGDKDTEVIPTNENDEIVPKLDYFSSEESLNSGISTIYEKLQTATAWTNILCAYTGADDLTSHNNYNNGNKDNFLAQDLFTPSANNGRLLSVWNEYYTTINTCNTIIDHAKHNDAIAVEITNKALAQAHFVRGLLFFRLTTIFGDIPLNYNKDVYVPFKVTKSREVLAQVILDFEFTIKHIENDRDMDATAVDYRGSKTAAKAFLAKTYMQLTGYPHHETGKWDNVRQLCQEIIDGGVYSLMDDYSANFEGDRQNNREMIFAHEFKNENSNYENPYDYRCRWYGDWWKKWKDMFPENAYAERFTPGWRKDYCIGQEAAASRPYEMYLHTGVDKFNYATNFREPEYEGTWATGNELPAMRYAEVLLMYAEACANTGNETAALEALNQVKRRAYANGITSGIDDNEEAQEVIRYMEPNFWIVPDPEVDFTGSGQVLKDEIVKERSFEFLAEIGGNYWLDLIRLEKVGEANMNRKTNPEAKNEIKIEGDPNNKDLWLSPIPQEVQDQME